MIQIRESRKRGHVDRGWLKTYHTFSFDSYSDPDWNRFSKLRVLNDDTVQPGQGFGMHPHRDMEIITYILRGALEHKDSMGNGSVIRPGDVQRMSAGTGIMHSEFNPSESEVVHLLQIWIFPSEKGLEPSYEQKAFSREERLGRFRLIASPTGAEGSVTIHQDASLYSSILEPGQQARHELSSLRRVWLHLARGEVKLGEYDLKSGDGAAISDESELTIEAAAESELLLFDLP